MLRFVFSALGGGRRRRVQPCTYAVGVFALTMLLGWLLYGGGGSGDSRTASEAQQLARSVHRSLEDTRPPECADVYGGSSDAASAAAGGEPEQVSVIVFAFLDGDSVVADTLASVIAHTPASALREVLVVHPVALSATAASADGGDGRAEAVSRFERVRADAERYGSLVRLVRAPTEDGSLSRRGGDVRAHFLVAHAAAAPVVALLSDDVVVAAGWLPPLLAELRRRPQSVVLPHLDGYDRRAGALRRVDVPRRWLFDWDFSVHPFEVGYQELADRRSEADVLPTPAFTGHAFAAYKRQLEALASYKHDMSFAGALEVAMLSWLCGDGVHIVPCSRAARAGTMRPSRPLDRRQADFVARRYLDAPALAAYEAVRGGKASSADEQQLRVEDGLKSMRTCKSFSWFMKEVAHDVFMPDENVIAYGVLGTSRGPTCFKRTAQMTLVAVPSCDVEYSNQLVVLNKRGQLRLDENCIKVEQNYAIADVCVDADETQFWTLSEQKQLQLKSQPNRCLAHSTDPAEENAGRQVVMLANCLPSSDNYYAWQVWNRFRVLRSRTAGSDAGQEQ